MRSIVLMMFLLISCSKSAPPSAPSFPVKIGTAIQRPAPITIEALGHVESILSVQIRSRIEGELTHVYFQEGQEVKKGDLLFTIDQRPYQAALDAAKAALDQSLANLALAEEKVKRYAQLTQAEYFSQIDYEAMQTNLAATTALVKQNKANVDSAAINLDYCWIYAPIDGLTGILALTLGNLVSADGSPLMTLNQMAPIYVTFSIPEIRLAEVRKLHREAPLSVLVAFEDFRKESFSGTLQMFDNNVDRETGMIKLRATFSNEDRALWPGQFVRTRLILKVLERATSIPFSAIQQTQSGPIVYVVHNNDTVESRSVQLGQREEDQIIILKGIEPGENIVIDGQLNLYPGAKIFIPESS
jgi:membrane fusion protein, multidrug efflux system